MMRVYVPAVVLLSACSVPVEQAHEAHDVWDPGEVSRVEIALDVGHVEIRAGASTRLTVVSRWTGDVSPTLETTRVGGTLVVAATCPTTDSGCRADVVLTVSAPVPVEVFTGAGDVRVEALSGDVFVDTGRGEIQLFDLSGSVDASTGRGDVYAIGVTGPALDAVATSGAVHLSR